MVGSTLKPDFKRQMLTIQQLPNDKWSLQVGCPSYRFIFDTWEDMVAEQAACFKDPEKWFIENKIEMGNKNLKPLQ